MVGTKITCPHCQAVLKSAKPLPAGMNVTCVKCGQPFPVATESVVTPVSGAGKASVQAKVGILVSTAPLQTPSPVVALPSSPDLPPLETTKETGDLGQKGRIILVGVGGVLLLLLAVGLIVLAFSSGGTTRKEEDQPVVELPEPLPPAPPVVLVKPLIQLNQGEEALVDRITRAGVAWLKNQKYFDGRTGGQFVAEYAAMAGLTLLECKVPPTDPAVQKTAVFVRQRSALMSKTYGLALFILFLDRLNDPQDKALIKRLTLRLVAGQSPGGGWSYDCQALTAGDEEALFHLLRQAHSRPAGKAERLSTTPGKKIPAFIQNHPALQNLEKRQGAFADRGGDNSNTQFALLALWAARRHELPVDPALQLVVRRFRNTQNGDGSWNYAAGHPMASQHKLPTMTCAGLLGLAVGYGLDTPTLRAGSGPQNDPQIQQALTHLSKHIVDGRRNMRGKPQPTEMYFLWSVERVAVLYRLAKIGEKDWYAWGMNLLAAHQHKDGHWGMHMGHGSTDLVDTCFALLFLQRVNLTQDLTDKIRELEALEAAQAGSKE